MPLGYIKLMVTYGNEPLTRTIKTLFLVLPCPSVYNCIFGRLTFGRLEAVASTVYLKMKFYSIKDEIIMTNVELGSAQRYHFLSLKTNQEGSAETLKKKKCKKDEVNLIALTNRCKLMILRLKQPLRDRARSPNQVEKSRLP